MPSRAAQIKTVGTINLTPTWEAMTRLYIALLEDGDAEGRETARNELFRMARIADTYVKEHAPKEPGED